MVDQTKAQQAQVRAEQRKTYLASYDCGRDTKETVERTLVQADAVNLNGLNFN